MGWWTGVLFAVGSTCFLVASVASQWSAASRPILGVTFFFGSICFTFAAGLQFAQAAGVEHGPVRSDARRRRRPASWDPRRTDWLAALIQLAGTLLFNLSTFEGMKRGLETKQIDLRVWAPDVYGSICFLVSSELAFARVCGRWFALLRRSRPWRIAALNLLGSVAFGVSAAAALVEPSTSEPVSAAIANAGTSVGAACFLAGAVMLVPRAARRG